MAKLKAVFICQQCGAQAPKWAGRCPACEAWNALVEEVVDDAPRAGLKPTEAATPTPLSEVALDETIRIRTGLGEELTLSNSLVVGAVTKNYSRAVKGPGYVLDTAVTIGYDTPWRTIHGVRA